MGIRLEVVSNDRDHYVITSDEPIVVEVIGNTAGIYRQSDLDNDEDNEPIGWYDGTITSRSWAFPSNT